MGRRARMKQERLGEKLLQIRTALGLSQSEMLSRLGFTDVIAYTRLSEYELGKNEPPLRFLLQYARIANVSMEALVDDDLDLPARLPSLTKHEGIRRTAAARRKKG
jgi:transcriptional regulator with XRE-family HTH domain